MPKRLARPGLAALAAAALLASAAVAAAATPVDLDAARDRWEPDAYSRFYNRNGRDLVGVEVPADKAAGMHRARLPVSLKAHRGEQLYFTIQAKGEGITDPPKHYLGVKFMLVHKSEDGRTFYHHVNGVKGTFDWKELAFTATITATADQGELILGLQDSSGLVEFDLGTLRVQKDIFPRVNANYVVRYPDRINNTPLLRGVMAPHKFTQDDLETLASWNVKLVRAQITRDWGKANTDRDLGEYDRWLDGKLDHLEDVLARARPLGIRFVLDIHSPPGGRGDDKDMAMFYEKKYADHFVAIWQRIAARFKGNPSVWAYDLVNEPVQTRPAPFDYWTLQKTAAEAVRAIDPDTPIMIEANNWDAPQAFEYLSPLAMDNVIYQVHMYEPGTFTHQGVHNTFGVEGKEAGIVYPGRINNVQWDKEMIRKTLIPVRKFQQRHKARIYVGEFSAAAWAPGAGAYLRDCIDVFEEYGWDWTYHAFREWDGWSVEHEGTKGKMVPSKDNDRKQALLDAFKRAAVNE